MENFSLFSLFILGLSYGGTACMFSCMPFLSPILVKNSHTLKEAFSTVIPFSLGRVFSYTLIAMGALLGAGFIKNILNDNTLFQIILGTFTLLMGGAMLYKTLHKQESSCSSSSLASNFTNKSIFALFMIGALVSINPCTPLLTLIALSVNASSITNALGMGLSFGIGAVVVPTLFYGFFFSTLVRGLLIEFKTHVKKIEIAASLLLIVVGVLLLNNQITL